MRSTDQNEKRRDDLFGNEVAINGLYLFLKNWELNRSKPGVLLLGPAGCGKTSSAYAIANELGMSVTELNASDTRGKNALKDILGTAVEFVQLDDEGGTRLILMDEVDGLSGQKDRGGLPEFIRLIKKSLFPIVCTANDPESDKIERLSKSLRVITFDRLDEFEIFDLLQEIAKKEKFVVDEDVLEEIAEKAAGDMRAAINELESHYHGTSNTNLERRDKMVVLTELFNKLFQSTTYEDARKVMNRAPSDYYRLLLHLFDETSKQCRSAQELAMAYNQIALADLTLSRIMRTQNWGLLRHFFTYIGPGIALSRESKTVSKIRKIGKYPSAFQMRGIAKRKQARAIQLAPIVAPRLHIPQNRFVFKDFNLFSKIVLGNNGAEVAAWLNLDDDHIESLQKLDPSSPLADEIDEARIKIGAIRLKQGRDIAQEQDPFELSITINEQINDDESQSNLEEIDNGEEEEEEEELEGQSALDDYF
ncbi:MAG: AAA family ATPase [Candidatus Kariarchaeaceae archaeon]